ncbi:MAG: hypothetical protein WAN34_01630 [Acidimicrobiia bacterium]
MITAPKTARVETPTPPRMLWWFAPAAFMAVISARLATSYDEVYWLAVVRKLAAGGRLYDTVIDNKGPLWYPIFTVFDWVPLPFWLTRGLLCGGIAVILMWLSDRFLTASGVGDTARHLSSASIALAMVTLSSFHLTIEMFGAVIVLIALAVVRRSASGAALILFAGLLLDPRIVLLIPAVMLVRRQTAGTGEARWRVLAPIGLATALAGTLYLLVPDLRFAVLEVGGATRFGEPFSFSATGTAAMSSLALILVIVYLQTRYADMRMTSSSWAMAAGASLIALVSLAPFTHYWTYLPLAALLLTGSEKDGDTRPRWWLILLAASLLPALLFSVDDAWDDRAVEMAFSQPEPYLSSLVASDDRVVVFTADPHPVARFPTQAMGRAPNSFYLGMKTSRQDAFLAEFDRDLQEADMLWIETLGQDVTELEPKEAMQPAWQILKRHLGEYACQQEIYPLLIFARDPQTCLSLIDP